MPIAPVTMCRLLSLLILCCCGRALAADCWSPDTPSEIRAAFADKTNDKLPETVCLPKVSKEIDDVARITKALGKMVARADPSKAKEYERNGEASGYLRFAYDRVFWSFIRAAKAVEVPPQVLETTRKVEPLVLQREERLRELKAQEGDKAAERKSERETIEAELDYLRSEYFKYLDRELDSAQLRRLFSAMPRDAMTLGRDAVPYLGWEPMTKFEALAPRVSYNERVTVVGHVHTHPSHGVDPTAHLPSATDIPHSSDRSERFPQWIGSFVYADEKRRLAWLVPSAYLNTKRPSEWAVNKGTVSLCYSLRVAELDDWRAPASRERPALESAMRDCTAWYAEAHGLALYEAADVRGEFRRIRFEATSWALRLVSRPATDAASLAGDDLLYPHLLSFIAFIEEMLKPGESPGGLTLQRQSEVLSALWKLYVSPTMPPGNAFTIPELQLLLLKAFSDSAYMERADVHATLCSRKQRLVDAKVLRCLRLGNARWKNLDAAFAARGFTITIGDFTRTNHEYNGQPTLKPAGEETNFPVSFGRGMVTSPIQQ